MEDKRVALLAVIVEDTSKSQEIQMILHQYSDYIVGRMGLPYHQRDISLISIAIDAKSEQINALCGKLGRIEGVTAKAVFAKTRQEGK